MKLWQKILLTIGNILLILLGILLSAGIIWYTLPAIQTTIMAQYLFKIISAPWVFWITIASCSLFSIIMILELIFGRAFSAKYKNFFIHIVSISIAAVAIGLSIATFALCNPLVANEVIISIPKKISIGVTLFGLIVFHIFSGKISTIINRKITAYDTAKELNQVGRSSVIFVNFLKLFELFFPEMLVLLLLCFCVSWNVASYFIIILISCVIPIIGNIEADFNIRKDAKKAEEKKQDQLAQKIAQIKRGM